MLAFDCIELQPGYHAERDRDDSPICRAIPTRRPRRSCCYPIGPDMEPTTDRTAVVNALDSVVGQRDVGAPTQFSLRPTEIIDISTEMPQEDGPILTAVAGRECGNPVDRRA